MRAIVGGLHFVRSSVVLFTNTAIVTVAVLLFWGSYTLTYGYATEVTDTGAFGYSVLEAALGLGAMVGGLAVGRWGERFRKGRAGRFASSSPMHRPAPRVGPISAPM